MLGMPVFAVKCFRLLCMFEKFCNKMLRKNPHGNMISWVSEGASVVAGCVIL